MRRTVVMTPTMGPASDVGRQLDWVAELTA